MVRELHPGNAAYTRIPHAPAHTHIEKGTVAHHRARMGGWHDSIYVSGRALAPGSMGTTGGFSLSAAVQQLIEATVSFILGSSVG